MDDPTHGHPVQSLNSRKRKSDPKDQLQGDCNAGKRPLTQTPILVDTTASCSQSNAPRQPSSTSWFPSHSTPSQVWSASDPPVIPLQPEPPIAATPKAREDILHGPAKRPRLDTLPRYTQLCQDPCRRCRRKREAPSRSNPPFSSRRHSRIHDMIDMGVVTQGGAAGTKGSLLGPSLLVPSHHPIQSSNVLRIPFDLHSPHIPPLLPLINRQTLKALDLDAILRNPQLRHDLLFDSGLQFRPVTSRRRKRELSEHYWSALVRELETGCTCISFDSHGEPHKLVCACKIGPLPLHTSMLALMPASRVYTLRMPSRIRTLLSEFLEVLLSVIQPLATISEVYVHVSTFQSQIRVHAAQAAYIRSIFDPELIEQELKHGVFDPSGLFRLISDTLKSHCAPMRDSAVEEMVQIADSCAPGRGGRKSDALKAVRMCLDILEIMKLDVANHQLQTLRPSLIRTSGPFHLKTFKSRQQTSSGSLELTRDWLLGAHRALLASTQPLPHSLYPSPLVYSCLQRSQRIYLAVLKAFTDLVFTPPSFPPSSTSLAPVSPISSPQCPSALAISSLPGYPETSYLDNTRLLILSADAADATALYMYIMLYRQLVFSSFSSDVTDGSSHRTQRFAKVDSVDLLQLKREIRDVAGAGHLGFCFQWAGGAAAAPEESEAWNKWRISNEAVVLQVSMRVQEARNRVSSSSASSGSLEEHSSSCSPLLRNAPSEHLLKLATRWSDSNMRPRWAASAPSSSPPSVPVLSALLRDRLRDVVFRAVVELAFPGRDPLTGRPSTIELGAVAAAASTVPLVFGTGAACGQQTGMEPLADEIRSLAERIARVACIHVRTYLPMYEEDSSFGEM